MATLASFFISTPHLEDTGEVNRQAAWALTHGRTVEIGDNTDMSTALFSILILLGS